MNCLRPRGQLSSLNKFIGQNFSVVCYIFENAYISTILEAFWINFTETLWNKWKFRRVVFLFGRSYLTAIALSNSYTKLENRDSVTKFTERTEDHTKSDFINKLSVKTFSMSSIEQIYNLKFAIKM